MKTAVSIPDDLFERADVYAQARGLNRSQLYAAALRQFLDAADAESLTAAINEVADQVNDDESTRDVVAYNRRRLARDADRW